MTMRYRVNVPAVASQTMAGEAILIHFDSGRYYSAEGAGADVIALIERGRTIGEVVDALAAATGEGRQAVEAAVAPFVGELCAEGLLVPAEAGEISSAAPALGTRFAAPRLVTYTDLEDLLRLDPIHDVDDAGWPIAKVG
jgi:hypothetical protein